MKLLRRTRGILAVLVFLLFRWTIPLFPRKVIVSLARALGRLAYLASRKKRRIAEANLEVVFGDSKSAEEKREIIIASFQAFALLSLDMLWFTVHTKKRVEKYLRYNSSFDIVFEDGPFIAVSAHFGNWEIAGLGCGVRGQPVTSIARPLKNSLINQVLTRLRTRTGSSIAPRLGGIRQVIRALRAGHHTAILVDQNTLPEDGGVFVPFFGLSVPVSRAAGALRSRTDARLIFFWCIPDEHGVYTGYVSGPFPGDGQSPTNDEIAAWVMRQTESIILKHPQFWMWSYKRWRYYRRFDDKDRYPFYARSYERHIGLDPETGEPIDPTTSKPAAFA